MAQRECAFLCLLGASWVQMWTIEDAVGGRYAQGLLLKLYGKPEGSESDDLPTFQSWRVDLEVNWNMICTQVWEENHKPNLCKGKIGVWPHKHISCQTQGRKRRALRRRSKFYEDQYQDIRETHHCLPFQGNEFKAEGSLFLFCFVFYRIKCVCSLHSTLLPFLMKQFWRVFSSVIFFHQHVPYAQISWLLLSSVSSESRRVLAHPGPSPHVEVLQGAW